MVTLNWPAVLVSAAVPLLFGAVWYSKSLFKLISGEEPSDKKHAPHVYILCYILGIPLAMMMGGFLSMHEPVDQHALHGGFHGLMAGLFMIMPALAVHFMFEGDRTARNMIYHILYWMFSLAIIGLIIFSWK